MCMVIQNDNISKFLSLPAPFVIITEPEDVRKVLTSKHECIDKPSVFKLLRLEHGSAFGKAKIWDRHRKIVVPYFSGLNLKNFFLLFNENSTKIVNEIGSFVGKGEFDVLHHNMVLSLDTILNVMELNRDYCNKDYEDQKKTLHSFETLFNLVFLRINKFWLQPQFIYKLTKAYKVETDARKVLKIADKVMNNIRENPVNSTDQDGKPRSFIQALMSEKNKLSDLEVNHEIITILQAGLDTAAITMSMTLLMLAMHRYVQDKVFSELQQVFSSKNAEISYEDLFKLSYLEMVINEAMRLFPTVPFNARLVDEEIVLSGYKIPAGANVAIPTIKIHRDVRFWGDDANVFRPERFEEENFQKIHPYAYIPFSKGPRTCIASRYSMQLMKIHLANILRRYEVETFLKFDELEFQVGFTLTVCQGYQIGLKERKYQNE